jgi:hypothetical protein
MLQVTGSNGGADARTIAVTVLAVAAPDPPTIGDASIENGYVNAANDTAAQALNGMADAGDTINVYLNGAAMPAFTTTADESGNWSVTLGQIADGSYSYTATATDAAGEVSSPSAPLSFTVDTSTSESAIADSAVTTGADGLSYINAANFSRSTTLTGAAEAGDTVTVSVNGGAALAAPAAPTVAPDGTWMLTLNSLANGDQISAVATAADSAGNISSSPAYSFTVDTSAPTVTSFAQTDPPITNANVLHYRVAFSEPVTGVSASDFSLSATGVRVRLKTVIREQFA